MISFASLLFLLYVGSLLPSNAKHDLYNFDVVRGNNLKGLSCLLIIAYHLSFHVEIKLFGYVSNWGAPIVSVFLFISGYGLMSSYLSKGVEYFNGFLKKRLLKILLPLLIVSVIYLVLVYLDQRIWPKDMFKTLLFTGITPLPYSWFAFSIIFFYLFFYLIFKQANIAIALKFVLLVLVTILYIVYCVVMGYERAWWVTAFAFMAGILYRFYYPSLFLLKQNTLFRYLFVPISLSIIVLMVKSNIELIFTGVYIILPILIVYLLSNYRLKEVSLLKYLGTISYEIYLFHGVWIFMLRGFHVYIVNDYIYALLVFISTIISAHVLHYVINKK